MPQRVPATPQRFPPIIASPAHAAGSKKDPKNVGFSAQIRKTSAGRFWYAEQEVSKRSLVSVSHAGDSETTFDTVLQSQARITF